MNPLIASLQVLAGGGSLSSAESERAFGSLLDGEVSEPAAAAFLTALVFRGETADDLDGAVRAARSRMIRWESGTTSERLLDTCGTGGDQAHTVNVSTAAAITAAACGIPVVKHGNRAASGNSGSSDVLTALGVAADPGPEALARGFAKLKIAFLFAPRFHPGLGRLSTLRRELPFRTLFNLVGPLCNPASPGHQLIGTPSETHARLLADVLTRMDHLRRAAVVTGSDGLDEVTLDGPTRVHVVEGGEVRCESWYPDDFGLECRGGAALRVSGPAESAGRIREALCGQTGPVRDYLLANTAAALWVAGHCSLREGVSEAAAAVDSGAALRLLENWALESQSRPGTR
jgi:anthranilate phosphoribosyltransferase